ncbi:MAG: rod shape-determining protein MreC [Bacilli bacterium]|nr:rod shape-determining protein MreC [Bacilli bacterium]
MKKTKKKKYKFIMVFLSIILVFVLFYIFINDNVKNNYLTSNLNDLTANIFKITTISFIKDNNNYNKDVKKEINNDYKKEINKLKDTLNLNSVNSDKNLINATVIKRNTNYWYNTITIDKGYKDNIKLGYAVINKNGLIGKIINVNKNTSDIKLLIALKKDNYISAKFIYDNNEYYGLINKYNLKKNELTLTNVIGEFDINKLKNTNVVTSGLSDSFSSGLLIGKIKDIKKDTFGISNTIILTPTVNFNNLDIVSVVGDK